MNIWKFGNWLCIYYIVAMLNAYESSDRLAHNQFVILESTQLYSLRSFSSSHLIFAKFLKQFFSLNISKYT